MCRGGPKCVAISSRSRHVAGVKRRLNSEPQFRELVPVLAQAAGDVGRLLGLPHEVQQRVAVPRGVEDQNTPQIGLRQQGQNALVGDGPELERRLLGAAGDDVIDGPNPHPVP
jgi:hypothetical protein